MSSSLRTGIVILRVLRFTHSLSTRVKLFRRIIGWADEDDVDVVFDDDGDVFIVVVLVPAATKNDDDWHV